MVIRWIAWCAHAWETAEDGDCERMRLVVCYDYQNCLLVGCLTSQQHASVSQGRICSDNFTCCHTEIQVADPTFHLTQSQSTDTGPASPSTDPITRPRKRESNPGSSAHEADALAITPTRRSDDQKNDNENSSNTHNTRFIMNAANSSVHSET